MTTTPAAPGRALLLIPGVLFWVLIIAGVVTENNTLIGAGVVLAVITIGSTLAKRVRAAVAEGDARTQLWASGTPTRARVVRLAATGARMNHNPELELELELTLPDQAPHRVTIKSYVSSIAIPRVQPDCVLDVRVDPNDKTRVALDPSL